MKGMVIKMDNFIDILLLTIIYFLVFYKRWRLKSNRTFVINTIFYFYIVIVLFFTVMPFRIPFIVTNHLFISTAIFIPFNDLIHGYYGAFIDIVLNSIMLIPFGFLYPLIRVSNRFQTGVMAFLFSLSIETYQLINNLFGISSRVFDVTDLITNTFGGVIGYNIWHFLNNEAKKYSRSHLKS